MKDSVTLHGKAMRVKLDVEAREGAAPSNVVKGFEALKASAQVTTEPGAAPATPAWNRK